MGAQEKTIRALSLAAFLFAACTPVPASTTAAPTDTGLTTVALLASVTATPTAALSPSRTLPPTASSTPTITLTPTRIAGPAPALPHIQPGLIKHGDRAKPYIALTFDLCQKPDKPAGFDRAILEALLAENAPATFFMGGDWMRTHPEETRLLASHTQFELGNHSWDHPEMPTLDEEHMHLQVRRTQDLLYQLTGRVSRLFRMPSGQYNALSLIVVAWHGLYTVQWDADTADPVPDNDAENIARLVRERAQNGSIVLMHANGRGWHTADALPIIIPWLRAQGYTLVTVPQLLGLDPIPDSTE